MWSGFHMACWIAVGHTFVELFYSEDSEAERSNQAHPGP